MPNITEFNATIPQMSWGPEQWNAYCGYIQKAGELATHKPYITYGIILGLGIGFIIGYATNKITTKEKKRSKSTTNAQE